MHPLQSNSPAIVYVDVKSPYAYVALASLLALEKEFGCQFDWRGLTLNIPSYLGSARKSNSGKVVENNRSPEQWTMVKYAYADARRYAERQGRMLKGTQKIWDSRLANIAINWTVASARDCLPEFLDAVYTPFWRRELDIEDPQVIIATLKQANVPTDGFLSYASGGGGELHDELNEQLHDHGIYGVPSVIIDGETYFGREHIPSIRWHLGGCVGPAPDIAYELVG